MITVLMFNQNRSQGGNISFQSLWLILLTGHRPNRHRAIHNIVSNHGVFKLIFLRRGGGEDRFYADVIKRDFWEEEIFDNKHIIGRR